MDKLVVHGGSSLDGPLTVGGSKNTALPLMAATLLAEGTSRITNVPDLRDVRTFSNVIRVAGPAVTFDADAHTLTLDAATVNHPVAPYELVKKMRASFYMLGALMGRCGEAKVSLPGGCAWGPRPVDLHIKGMEAFGAEIELEEGYVRASAPGGRLDGGSFRLEPSSVGATINLLLGAVRAKGASRIENAAQEPDVVAFGEALQSMGAQIDGLGTDTIEIQGVDRLDPVSVRNTPDRIELLSMTATAYERANRPNEAAEFNLQAEQLSAEYDAAVERMDEAEATAGTLLDQCLNCDTVAGAVGSSANPVRTFERYQASQEALSDVQAAQADASENGLDDRTADLRALANDVGDTRFSLAVASVSILVGYGLVVGLIGTAVLSRIFLWRRTYEMAQIGSIVSGGENDV